MTSISHVCVFGLFVLPTLRASIAVPARESPARSAEHYDAFSTRIYDPAGRVLQLEYALQATKRGGASVGATIKDFAVLASWSPRSSRRQLPASAQSTIGVWKADKHVALAGSGMAMDAVIMKEEAQRHCLQHRYIYDSPISINRLVSLLAQEVHDTERHRIVPYAIDLLIGGYHPGAGVSLFRLGPAGVFRSCRADAVGSQCEQAQAYLQKQFDADSEQHSLHWLIETVAKALVRTMPAADAEEEIERQSSDTAPFPAEDVSMMVIGRNSPVAELRVEWTRRWRRLEVFIPDGIAKLCEETQSAASASR